MAVVTVSGPPENIHKVAETVFLVLDELLDVSSTVQPIPVSDQKVTKSGNPDSCLVVIHYEADLKDPEVQDEIGGRITTTHSAFDAIVKFDPNGPWYADGDRL